MKYSFWPQTLEEARKKLATLDNELRKEKMISRRYQVATERLMQFVEVKSQTIHIFNFITPFCK